MIKLKKTCLKTSLSDRHPRIQGVEITGLSANSKSIAPGKPFHRKKRATHMELRFIPDAVAAGAVAILTDIYNPFLSTASTAHRIPM